jgi:RNA polymerase sigma factor (TIGR02999 family)
MADVTELLTRWNGGDAAAFEALLPLVYDELHRLAGNYMRRERPDHTLQPTALVHEAYLRLAGVRDAGFQNRVHFYGAAAQAMRRVLVDHARQRRALKRDQAMVRVDFDAAFEKGVDPRLDLVALDEALDRLTAVAARPAKVVELRFFGGLSIAETAAFLNVAPATVKRHWTFARAWLHRALSETPGSPRPEP